MYHAYLIASICLLTGLVNGHPGLNHKRGFGSASSPPSVSSSPPPSPSSSPSTSGPSSYSCHDGSAGTLMNSYSVQSKPLTIWSCEGSAPLPPAPQMLPTNMTFQNGQWWQEAAKLWEEGAEAFAEGPKPASQSGWKGKARHDVGLSKRGKRDILSLLETPCTTYCNTPAGAGPDPNDCQQMIDADAMSGNYSIAAGTYLVWTFETCQVIQNDLMTNGEEIKYNYDWNHWAGVVNYLAWNCQATQNAQGGSCHFNDSTNQSYILVQAAPGSS